MCLPVVLFLLLEFLYLAKKLVQVIYNSRVCKQYCAFVSYKDGKRGSWLSNFLVDTKIRIREDREGYIKFSFEDADFFQIITSAYTYHFDIFAQLWILLDKFIELVCYRSLLMANGAIKAENFDKYKFSMNLRNCERFKIYYY